MMESFPNPWAELKTPKAGLYSRLRVSAEAQHAVFWIRDDHGYPGLLVAVEPEATPASLRKAGVSLKNIQTDLSTFPDYGYKAVIIRLISGDKSEVFYRLCADIADQVIRMTDDASPLATVCERLKKWQTLLANRSSALLSEQEVRGLFAELRFLHELLHDARVGEEAAVRAWKGPDRAQHDFVLGDTAVEIKAISGDHRGTVRISSEDQLFTALHRLYLRIYTVFSLPGKNEGESLNDLVRQISARIFRNDLRDAFEGALWSAGYIHREEYDVPHFAVSSVRTCAVTDGFPRIVRNELPVGIEAVTYDLLLKAADPFIVADGEILEHYNVG